jgi:hypothetical protein
MAFDLCKDGFDNDEDGMIDDCGMQISGVSTVPPVPEYDPVRCNYNRTGAGGWPPPDGNDHGPEPDGDPEDDCHPFEEVRAATKGLLSRMYFPYDRMGLVTYASVENVDVSLQDGTDCEVLEDALGVNDVCLPTEPEPDGMQVSIEPGNPPPPVCNPFTGDPRGCTNTNTADGLTEAGNQFGYYTREEAVWVVILLSDGAANAKRISADVGDPNSWLCPGSTFVQPFCRDPWAATRHAFGDGDYDADDAARDAADFVGCDATTPAADCTGTGQGAVIFSIGLGDLMINSTACDASYGGSCEPDLGESLLRFVAAVGDDGDPATDPCNTIGTGNSCGNYYFSPTGSGLLKVFEAIASRIFTRITH